MMPAETQSPAHADADAAPGTDDRPCLLIDMDGMLVDSTALVESTWTDFAALHGLDAAEVIDFAHGRPTGATVAHFLTDPDLAQRETASLRAHEEGTSEGVVEIPGAAAFLTTVPAGRWALVTSASRLLATNRMLAAGLEPPETGIYSDDITAGKPDPQSYLLGAERLGVVPGDCVALEDSRAGIASALAAGAHVLVVGDVADHDGELPRVPDLRGLTYDDVVRLALG